MAFSSRQILIISALGKRETKKNAHDRLSMDGRAWAGKDGGQTVCILSYHVSFDL